MLTMKEKLQKIKMLFADVDNTLLNLKMYDENGKRIIGVADADQWLKYNINHNAYEKCIAPKGMENLVTSLHFKADAKIYGLTECANSFEYNAKYNRLAECYPGIFEHHGDLISVESRHKKVAIMDMICEKEGLNHDEVMFIDDSFSEVMAAFEAGYFSMHTTEAMDLFADPENEILKSLQHNNQDHIANHPDNDILLDINQLEYIKVVDILDCIRSKFGEDCPHTTLQLELWNPLVPDKHYGGFEITIQKNKSVNIASYAANINYYSENFNERGLSIEEALEKCLDQSLEYKINDPELKAESINIEKTELDDNELEP